MTTNDDLFDAPTDVEIVQCIDLARPRSFFLYAGAGSGKTRSLVNAIRHTCSTQGRKLSLTGKKIGVITYTNAACDEIKQRLDFDPRVEVMTIHAFSWSLVKGYNADIRIWVAQNLEREISVLEQAQAKGRASKASEERARSMENKRRRLASLSSIARFVYSPTSDNRTRGSLNHAEVIAMTAEFITMKPGLRRMLISRFPILLIDESQDTNKALMDAFLHLEGEFHERFCLGLFGDTMQRIYADGKDRLDEAIPKRWAQPRKRMNHRCPKRIVEVINHIRREVDGEEQFPRSDADVGFVRIFIVQQGVESPFDTEATVRERMAIITGDRGWQSVESVKTLALEHMMSARRFGFVDFFEPLWSVDSLRTSLLQGTGPGLGLFIREVLPLIRALRAKDRFGAMATVRQTSLLLDRKALQEAGVNQLAQLAKANEACEGLLSLITTKPDVSAYEVLNFIAQQGLFIVPDSLAPFVEPGEASMEVKMGTDDVNRGAEDDDDVAVDAGTELGAWRRALEAPLHQIELYDVYVQGKSQFGTHQGIKGLEFPRVLVVINDDEARGFLFAYDKFFGAKEKSKTDYENEAIGKETSLDRTRRLFYVTCSRAEKSLAIVYYAPNPIQARDAILELGWFEQDEVQVLT